MSSGMGDKIRGKGEELRGRAQDAVGGTTDDERASAQGRADRGKARSGRARTGAQGQLDEMVDTSEEATGEDRAMGSGSGRMTVNAEDLEDGRSGRG